MSTAIFIYKQDETKIQCNPTDKMKNIIEGFCSKLNLDENNLLFIYNGSVILNKELAFQEQINLQDKENKKMKILVYDTNENANNCCFKRSKEIICPECKENILINITDYIITLQNCKNGHKIENISLEDFENKQKINIAEITCDKCGKNQSQAYKNEFHICLDCDKKLCPGCKLIHNKSHKIIDLEKKKLCLSNT